jgi:hypothetical protein
MSRFIILGESMKGIQFVSNDRGQKVAVQINLQKYGEIWEDFYDSLIARSRAKEPRESMEIVKKSLINQGKLRG